MQNENRTWVWAGVAVSGLLLFFAYYTGGREVAGIAFVLAILAALLTALAIFYADNQRRHQQEQALAHGIGGFNNVIQECGVGGGIRRIGCNANSHHAEQ